MPKKEWRGDARPVPQITRLTAPEASGPVEFYIGGRPLGWNLPWAPNGSGAWPTADLIATWNASPLEEFREVRASGAGATLTLTAVEAGRPFIVTTTVGGLARSNEVQRIDLLRATGGTFTLRFNGETTAAIAFNAAAAAVQSALEGLSLIAPGDVTVTGGAGSWQITFGGTYALTNVPVLIPDYSGLTGGTCTVLIETVQTGALPVNEVQLLTLPGNPTGGVFTLSFNGVTTSNIGWNAAASHVQTALRAVLGPESVTCSGGPLPGTGVTITFGGDMGGINQPLLVANGSGLTGAALAMSVATTVAGSLGTNAKYRFRLTADPEVADAWGTTGFRFVLYTSMGQTGELSYTATAAQIRSAIETSIFGGYANGSVLVTGSLDDSWLSVDNYLEIEFGGKWHSTRIVLTATEVNNHGGVSLQTTVVSLGAAGTNELQTLTQTGSPTGTFRLGWGGAVSDPIPYGATALAVEDVLVRMPPLGQAGVHSGRPDAVVVNPFPNFHGAIYSTRATVRVTGGPLGTAPLTLQFASNGLQSTNVAQISVDEGLTNVSPSVDGVPGISEIQRVSLTGTPWGGTFTLTHDGQTTSGIAYNASASQMLDALEALSNLDAGDVVVSKSGSLWSVTWSVAKGNVPTMTGAGAGLKNGVVTNSVVAEGGLSVGSELLQRSAGPWHADDPFNWIGDRVPESEDLLFFQFGQTGPRWGISWLAQFTVDAGDATRLILDRHTNFVNGQKVRVDSSGTLPTGLSAGTSYYVIVIDDQTIRLSATRGGSAISLSGGSGTHRVYVKLAGYLSLSGWTGWTGTRVVAEKGFREYRPLYLSCGWDDGARVIVGEGQTGAGSQLQHINTHDFRVVVEVLNTQGSIEPALPAMLWVGQHVSNTTELIGGEFGAAMLRGETAALSRLTIRSGDCSLGEGVTFASGGVIDQTGGSPLKSKASLDGVLWLRG